MYTPVNPSFTVVGLKGAIIILACFRDVTWVFSVQLHFVFGKGII